MELFHDFGVVPEIFLETNEYDRVFITVMDYLGIPLSPFRQFRTKS
jgi:hypothetical protein